MFNKVEASGSGKSFAYDISGELSIDMVVSLIYKKEKNNKESLYILTHSKCDVAITTDSITIEVTTSQLLLHHYIVKSCLVYTCTNDHDLLCKC